MYIVVKADYKERHIPTLFSYGPGTVISDLERVLVTSELPPRNRARNPVVTARWALRLRRKYLRMCGVCFQ